MLSQVCLQFGWFTCDIGGASQVRLLGHTWPRDFPVEFKVVCMPVISRWAYIFTYLSQTQRKILGKTFISITMKIEHLYFIQTPQCVSFRKIDITEFQRIVKGHSL